MNYIEIIRLGNGYNELLKNNNTRYLLTITFNKDLTLPQSLDTGKSLLKRLRNEYFGKNKKWDFIKGYVIIEKQKTGRPHLHFLIQDHSVFQRPDKPFQDTVIKKCKNLKLINENVGVDIRDYYHHNLEGYLIKSIEYDEDNFDFIKPLTYYGF